MSQADDNVLGERIGAIRKALGYSPSELARAASVDRMTLVRIETGGSKNPRIETVKAITRALHLSEEGCRRVMLTELYVANGDA